MAANRRKIHKYLGMNIYCMTKGLCKITMFDYIKEILETFDEIDPKATGTKSSVAPANLIVMMDDCNNIETRRVNNYTR